MHKIPNTEEAITAELIRLIKQGIPRNRAARRQLAQRVAVLERALARIQDRATQ